LEDRFFVEIEGEEVSVISNREHIIEEDRCFDFSLEGLSSGGYKYFAVILGEEDGEGIILVSWDGEDVVSLWC